MAAVEVGGSMAQRTVVAARLREPGQSACERERLETVKGAILGWDRVTVAAWSGRGEATVARWLAAFRAGAVEAVVNAPRAGRPRRATAAYLDAPAAAVTADPRTLGRAFDVWTSARLGAYLTETTGTRIAPGWLRVLLHRRRFACGRPKHTLAHLQDPAEAPACAERLREAGGKGGGFARPPRAPLRGRCARRDPPRPGTGLAPGGGAADPAGGGDQPPADRLRQRRGPWAGAGRGGRGAGRLGRVPALPGGDGRAPCGHGPGGDPGAGQRLLPHQQTEPAGLGRRALAERADWLEVVPLARYSPELNPKEREWRRLKRDHRCHLAADLPGLVAELLAGLGRVGGARCDIVDAVPAWWMAGRRRPVTGRPVTGPRGARTHSSRIPA